MQSTTPFWLKEGAGQTHKLSQSAPRLRETTTQLVEYLQSGMNTLGAMKGRDAIVMERFFDEVSDMQVLIHSPFGRPLLHKAITGCSACGSYGNLEVNR